MAAGSGGLGGSVVLLKSDSFREDEIKRLAGLVAGKDAEHTAMRNAMAENEALRLQLVGLADSDNQTCRRASIFILANLAFGVEGDDALGDRCRSLVYTDGVMSNLVKALQSDDDITVQYAMGALAYLVGNSGEADAELVLLSIFNVEQSIDALAKSLLSERAELRKLTAHLVANCFNGHNEVMRTDRCSKAVSTSVLIDALIQHEDDASQHHIMRTFALLSKGTDEHVARRCKAIMAQEGAMAKLFRVVNDGGDIGKLASLARERIINAITMDIERNASDTMSAIAAPAWLHMLNGADYATSSSDSDGSASDSSEGGVSVVN